jgi:hypothetical protein
MFGSLLDGEVYKDEVVMLRPMEKYGQKLAKTSLLQL